MNMRKISLYSHWRLFQSAVTRWLAEDKISHGYLVKCLRKRKLPGYPSAGAGLCAICNTPISKKKIYCKPCFSLYRRGHYPFKWTNYPRSGCYICKEPAYEVHHIIPVSYLIKNPEFTSFCGVNPANLVLLCASCHSETNTPEYLNFIKLSAHPNRSIVNLLKLYFQEVEQ